MPASISIRSDLEARLFRVAESTGEPVDLQVEKALEEYVSEQEAALIALQRAAKAGPTVSLQELEKELGVDG